MTSKEKAHKTLLKVSHRVGSSKLEYDKSLARLNSPLTDTPESRQYALVKRRLYNKYQLWSIRLTEIVTGNVRFQRNPEPRNRLPPMRLERYGFRL